MKLIAKYNFQIYYRTLKLSSFEVFAICKINKRIRKYAYDTFFTNVAFRWQGCFHLKTYRGQHRSNHFRFIGVRNKVVVYIARWLSFLPSLLQLVRFQVLTAANKKLTAFWVVAPCSLVQVYRRFRGASCLHLKDIIGRTIIALVIQAASASETSVDFHQIHGAGSEKTATFMLQLLNSQKKK
jgi:hypothetical protein